MSFYNITYLVTYKPIADSHENKIEIFNETCILLFSYMVATCLNVAMPQDMNDLIGFLMIGFTASNIIVNLAIVGMMTVRDMYSVLKDLPNQIKTK